MKDWRPHWLEYALEAFGLGLFMVSAAGFGVLLFHPQSAAVHTVPDPTVRRGLMGLAMGATAFVNTYAPWGRRSGAHLNPAVTLTFYRLGKVAPGDLAGYLIGQLAGAVLGIAVAARLFGGALAHPAVDYVATVPGPGGWIPAFLGELVITFVLMGVVLTFLASGRLARFTGVAAAALVALYITVEAPLSGMSMNPARTLASALWAGIMPVIWIYLVAPVVGMLGAAELRRRIDARPHCAKLDHDVAHPCLFCEWTARHGRHRPPGSAPESARSAAGPAQAA